MSNSPLIRSSQVEKIMKNKKYISNKVHKYKIVSLYFIVMSLSFYDGPLSQRGQILENLFEIPTTINVTFREQKFKSSLWLGQVVAYFNKEYKEKQMRVIHIFPIITITKKLMFCILFMQLSLLISFGCKP